jgi:PIN domain nuclease of toxin-antitoxin system
MKLLLDTHALLWWLLEDPKLSAAARDSIAPAGNRVFVSSASAWELATKHRLGKLSGLEMVLEKLPHLLRRERFEVLPIGFEDALLAGSLPGPHRDPFDRMLIAQSRNADLTLVTADPVFTEYGVRVIW